jgi:hypothetical protein
MGTTVREHVWRAAGVAALFAVAAACAAAPRQRPLPTTRIEGGPGTLAEARKYLEGRWALESFEVHPPGKPPIVLKGSGVLNYDDFGNLRMEIRAGEAESDLLRAAGINIRDGVISSEGRTVIDLQNRTLTYFLEGQPDSMKTGGGPLAANRPRHWEVTADVLTLTTRDDSGAPLSISRWKRSP